MAKYLIVKCVELADQYECDADRTPIALVDDWEAYCIENADDDFEVWKLNENGSFVRIKTYYEEF